MQTVLLGFGGGIEVVHGREGENRPILSDSTGLGSWLKGAGSTNQKQLWRHKKILVSLLAGLL
jgi:hypothetical protein